MSKWMGRSDIPTVAKTKFGKLFAMSAADVDILANFISMPDPISAIFSTPRDWLNSLILFPFDVTYYADTLPLGTHEYLNIFESETQVECREVSANWLQLDLGEAYIAPYFNNFADYNGYTKIKIWLPYYGFVEILPNECMGKYLEFVLSVDCYTGSACYYIGVSPSSITTRGSKVGNADKIDCKILATYTFQLGYQIPLGSTNAGDIYRNIQLGVLRAGTGFILNQIAIGGASKTRTVNTERNPNTGRQITTSTKTSETEYTRGENIDGLVGASINALSAMKVTSQSDVVNNPMLLGNGSLEVKVLIYRPIFEAYNNYVPSLYGKPLGQAGILSQFEGYTEIGKIHLEGFSTATDEEKAKIERILMDGFILPEN